MRNKTCLCMLCHMSYLQFSNLLSIKGAEPIANFDYLAKNVARRDEWLSIDYQGFCY